MSARSRERLADELATLGAARLAIRVRIGEFGTWTPIETTSMQALVREIDETVAKRPPAQQSALRRIAAQVDRGDFAEADSDAGDELRGHLQIQVLPEIGTPRIRVTAGPGNYADFTAAQATDMAHDLLAAAKRLEEETSE